MWVIACFTEENNVEVVPYSWMKGDQCYWPTMARDKLKKSIEGEVEPDNSEIWKKYKARIIGKPYEQLQKAREKANMALTRSDIETDMESKKRKRRQNPKYISDSSSVNEELPSTASSSLSSLDLPVKKSKKSLWTPTKIAKKKGSKKDVESPLKIPGDLPQLRKSPRKNPKTSTPQGPKSKMPETRPIPQYLEQLEIPSTIGFRSPGSSTRTETFEQLVINNQNLMKNMLKTIWGELTTLKNQVDQLVNLPMTAGEPGEDFSEFIKNLPAKTLQELHALEEGLIEKSKESEMVNFLARIGGANLNDSIRRALRATLNDEVACQYSWAGQKGKLVFSTLRVRAAISKAVLKHFPEANDKQIENIVKDWLRPSKNRLLSRQKIRRPPPEDEQPLDNPQ